MEGDTAMSKISEETIKCPKCGKESKFVMWSSINTVLDPEMKKKVLTGEIFKFKCNKCGCEARINYSSLYHQMEDSIMFRIRKTMKVHAICLVAKICLKYSRI